MKIKILKIVTLYLALYRVETQSFILTEDRLRVFVSRTPRKIFGPKTETVTEGQIKIHIVKLHEL